MHLTPKIRDYIKLVATSKYLSLVENGDIPLLPTRQRQAFVEQLVKMAIFAIDATPNEKKNLTREYERRIKRYFASRSNILRLYRQFEVNQAIKDGRLSPERLVDNFLNGTKVTYAQRSELSSYAQRVIVASMEKRRSLDQIVRNVNARLKSAPPYLKIVEKKEASLV